jgi:hypothetical protein
VNVGLIQACDDRELLAVDLWPKQREILAAIERPDKRLSLLCLGRRSGKTTMAAIVLLWACLLRDDLAGAMRLGETRYAVGVAVNLKQARLLVQAARSIVERSPILADMLSSSTEDELRFTNDTALAAFPCTSRGIRGWPVCSLVMDEAAHFLSETEGPAVADRVLGSLVPATAQFGAGARIILASTPFGQDGLFATLYQQASSGELPDAQCFHATTREANPTITDELLAAEELRDPEGFRAEFEASFLGSGAAYLDFDRFEVAGRDGLPPDAVTVPILGLDPSFSRDPFGAVVVGRDPDYPRRLLVAHVEAWQPPRRRTFLAGRRVEDEMLGKAAELAKRYRARVVTDQHAAPAVVDRLRGQGLSILVHSMTATSKTEVFAELRARLYSGELELYEHGQLLAELRRLRAKFTAGQASVVNPRVAGSHGDLAQALALSVYEHRHSAISEAPVIMPTRKPLTAGVMTGEPGDPTPVAQPPTAGGRDPDKHQGSTPPAGWPGQGTGWRDRQF